jgi:hypothetical protein
MDGPRRTGPTPAEPGGGGRRWRPSAGYLAIALAIAVGVLVGGWMAMPSPAPDARGSAAQAVPPAAAVPVPASAPLQVAMAASSPPVAAPVRPSPAASAPAPAAGPRISRTRDPDGDLSPDLADHVNEGERPTMAQVIERLHAAGVYSGLGAFSPPGTRPPLVGLAVPEDFVLPDGYVRHYQATDDGQRIEPILMFSPDHAFFDSAGRPVAIPPDRVVPPDMAPPGLPIRRIVIPAPTEPGRPGS